MGFTEKPTHVFLPTIRDDQVGAAGGFGDMLATSKVITMANALFPPADQLTIHTRQDNWQTVEQENIVSVGSGKYSRVYRDLIDALDPPLHFFDTAVESFQEIRNRQRTIVYSPQYAEDGSLKFDIGLLVLAENPFNTDRQVLLAAGSHTYGSAIVVDYLADRSGARDLKDHLGAARLLVVVGAPVGVTGHGKPERISNIITW